VYEKFSNDRVLTEAAAVTYFGLLAIFPAIAALVSVYGIFADPAAIERTLGGLNGVVPEGALGVLRDQMIRVAAQSGGALGAGAVIGILVALWSANSGMKALFDALNIVHGEKERRGFIARNAVSLVLTLGALGFVLVAVGAIVALPLLLEHLPRSDMMARLVDLARWPGLALAVIVALSVVYGYGPSRSRPRRRWLTWGSVTAGLLWLAASGLFSWYTANFGNYNRTYGSLGAIIGFMTWLWISAIVILLGGEIDAVIEQRAPRGAPAMPGEDRG
jgi:membrane protein